MDKIQAIIDAVDCSINDGAGFKGILQFILGMLSQEQLDNAYQQLCVNPDSDEEE